MKINDGKHDMKVKNYLNHIQMYLMMDSQIIQKV